MKSLFEQRFPFVLKPDEELTEDQLQTKRLYEATYSVNTISNDCGCPEEVRQTKATKRNQLREVHGDEPGTGGEAE